MRKEEVIPKLKVFTPTTLAVLYAIHKYNLDNNKPPNISAVSTETGMSYILVQGKVKTLVEKGLIEAVRLKNDRRSIYLKLTDKGKALVEKVAEAVGLPM